METVICEVKRRLVPLPPLLERGEDGRYFAGKLRRSMNVLETKTCQEPAIRSAGIGIKSVSPDFRISENNATRKNPTLVVIAPSHLLTMSHSKVNEPNQWSGTLLFLLLRKMFGV